MPWGDGTRRRWVRWGAIALLALPFVLGYLKGSTHETTPESISGGLGTVVVALVIALVVRACYWLIRRRAIPFLSPWIAVIAAAVGVFVVLGSANREREERHEESVQLAEETADCAGATGSPLSGVKGVEFRPLNDPQIEAALEATGVGPALDFYEARMRGRVVATAGLAALGGDQEQLSGFSSELLALAERFDAKVRQEQIGATSVTVASSPTILLAGFTTDCHGVMLGGTNRATAELLARRILAP